MDRALYTARNNYTHILRFYGSARRRLIILKAVLFILITVEGFNYVEGGVIYIKYLYEI